jgi:hypothetical protein
MSGPEWRYARMRQTNEFIARAARQALVLENDGLPVDTDVS